MKLDWKRNNPVNMVGDGKAPNKFWVTASTDFAYRDKDTIEYAEKAMKDHGIESKEHKDRRAVFSTYQEAYDYATKVADLMPDEPKKDGIHRVTIEDRLNGVLGEYEILGDPGEWGWKFCKSFSGTEPDEDGNP